MADIGKSINSLASFNTNYVNKTEAVATRKIPMIRVTFHTEDGCYQAIGSNTSAQGYQVSEPTYQVISVTTQKQLRSPAGAFNITLAGDMWVKDVNSGGKPSSKLRPNDLVVISMGYKDDDKLATVMVGLIDRVELNRSISGDRPSVTTMVSGRDFGKVLLKGMLKFYPSTTNGVVDPVTKPYFLKDFGQLSIMTTFFPPSTKADGQSVVDTIPTTADRIMRFLVQKLYDVEWAVYDTATSRIPTNSVIPPPPNKHQAKMGNILRYVFGEFEDYFLPVNPAIASYEGSVWNLFERILLKPFGEMFLDTRNETEAFDGVVKNPKEFSSDAKGSLSEKEGKYPAPAVQFGDDRSKVVFYMRKTPFDQNLWNSLKTHSLDEIDVIRETLGYSDNEHYNLFFVGSRIAPGNIPLDMQKKVFPPIFTADHEKKARRYGLSPLEVEIPALQLDKSKVAKPEEVATKLKGFADPSMKKLQQWFDKNEEMESGSLEVRGNGTYKVGQVVYYTQNKKDYYIESVTQSFHMYQEWKTTLGVTRGYDKTKRFGS